MPRLTLEDIAQRSGVSRSTVSRVMNGDVSVKPQTRQRVLDVATSLDFQPNLAARSLAAGRTNIIGLVAPAGVAALFDDPYFPQLIQGVSTACNACGYSLMLSIAEPEYERRTVRQLLHNGLLDGVVVSSTLMDDVIVRALCESSMPFVLVGRHPTLDVNFVDVDNFQAGRQATLHLLHLGRRRVAAISGPQNVIPGHDRLAGYRKALQECGLRLDPELVGEGDFSEQGGYLVMRRLLPARPDAVFAASDLMAVGALRALREAGLRVPEDVAVVGYDDVPIARQTEPPLTTVRQPTRAMGSMAVETLNEILHDPEAPPRRVILETELIVRYSCGALRQKTYQGEERS